MKTFKEYLREQGGPSLPGPGDMGAPSNGGAGGPMPYVPQGWEEYRDLERVYGLDPQHPHRRIPTQVQPWWHPWEWGLPQEFDWILPHIPPVPKRYLSPPK